MAMDTRELFARLLQCEAGGEGPEGIASVATVVMNRATVRISQGGDVRNIIEQMGQFVCMRTSVGGQYNPQNVYNISPEPLTYQIADWALAGNTFSAVGNSLFFFNPFSDTCPRFFPANGIGIIYNRIGDHCFYAPTEKYADT